MHVSEFTLQNITSYRDRTCFSLGPELNIVIGPNGGGKTNAIQCLWIALEKFFFQHYKVEDKPEGRQITTKDILSQRYNRYLEKHDESQDSYVEIVLIPERSDAANIRSIQRAIDQINSEYKLLQFARVSDITEAHLHAFDHGSPLHFTVKNGALLQPPAETPESAFLLYCKAIDLVTRYATFDPSFDVTVPIFFLQSVRQASAGYDVNVGGLNPQGYYEARQGVIVSAGGGLSGLASQHFGRIKLKAIKAASKREGGPSEIQIFNADPEVRLLRKYLELLGYEWDLVERSLDSWNYIAKFKKDGRDVDPNKFSSGEREIFNFLYGIIPTNVKSGVVIIDEPELHLHPKWQGIFLSLFQEFARERGLQFVLSTHSPAFVTHRTIDAVTRVFQRDGVSRRATVRSEALPNRAQLVRLVHSHNNERLFFADRVVLVEGITDRLVVENLVGKVGRWVATRETVEVIEVHGKHNFGYYRQILQGVETPTLIIADLDYIIQIGSAAVKQLFVADYESIDKKALLDKKTRDRSTLIEAIEEAYITGDFSKLSVVIVYLKERFQVLKHDLDEPEQALLEEEFVRALQRDVLIWRRGDIEDYLPLGARSVGEIIELLADDDWLHRLDPDVGNELVEVTCWVVQLDSDATARAKKQFVDVTAVEAASG